MPEALTFLGIALALIGGLMLLWVAFKESLLWGLGCLFIPLVGLVFVFTHWYQAKTAFLLQVLGIALIVVGAILKPEQAVESGALIRLLYNA